MTPLTIYPFLMSLLQGTDARGTAPSPADHDSWEHIISEADEQGISFILYRWLTGSGVIHTLAPVLSHGLKQRVVSLAAKNLALSHELAAILRAFGKKGVACMPLRGPTLAEQLYGDLAARPMEDLDVLVQRKSLPKVVEILQGLGFHHIDVRQGFAWNYNYTLEFAKNRHGTIMVEPHWTLAYPPFVDRVDMDSVWARSMTGRAVGVETQLLCHADLLLHLCYHLMHWHERAPLLWYFDLDQLIRQEASSLDWSKAILAARESGQELLVTRILERLTSLFNTPVPDHVLLGLSPHDFSQPRKPAPGFLERRMVELLAGGSQLRGREEFAFFFAIKGLRSKLRYALSLLFPSPAFMRFRYGPAPPLKLVFRYGSRALQLGWEGLQWLRDLLFVTLRRYQS